MYYRIYFTSSFNDGVNDGDNIVVEGEANVFPIRKIIGPDFVAMTWMQNWDDVANTDNNDLDHEADAEVIVRREIIVNLDNVKFIEKL